MRFFFYILLSCFGAVIAPALAGAQDGLRSPVSVEIQLNKTVFTPFEQVEGQVILMNRASVSIVATYDIKVFYQEELKYTALTEIPAIFPGANRYSLQDMGVPMVQRGFAQSGAWRILIVQRTLDPQQGAEAGFLVKQLL